MMDAAAVAFTHAANTECPCVEEPWRCRYHRGYEDGYDLALARLASIQALVDEQAEDDALWFDTAAITEAYFQQELRRLHAAIEAVTDV